MDADSLAERILKDLDSIFSKDPFIAEVDVVPLEECTQNKCPVIHVAHQVAIESWCIKHVYRYAYRHLLEWRLQPHKTEAHVLLGWTRAVLIINPDIQVAWNIRRELVMSQKQEIKDELQFSSIVLTRKPKCSEVFTHRRWLLEWQMKKVGCTDLPADLMDLELELCQKAASAYQHNYYAWSHRIWVVQRAAVPTHKLVLEELERTDAWVQSHISDNSGFQFRQFLFSWWIKQCSLPVLLDHCQLLPHNPPTTFEKRSSGEQCTELVPALLREMTDNSELISFYGSHEALWYHRRFILHTLYSIFSEDNTQVPNNVPDTDRVQKVKRNKLDHCRFGLEHESKFLQTCLEKSQNDSGQISVLERQKKWLQNVLTGSLPNYH